MWGSGGRRWGVRGVAAVAIAWSVAACGTTDVPVERAGGAAPLTADTSGSGGAVDLAPVPAEPATTVPVAPASVPAPTTVPAPIPTTAPPPPPRTVVQTGYAPFAVVEQLVLVHPAAVVERVGFHQAGHDGARRLEPTATAAAPVVLEDRGRGTDLQTAADIVVPPDAEIRVPVTGTVKRAGSYVLYCDEYDHYAVIEPDARPGWEVKVLHVDGIQLQPGQRVEAGVTVVAPRPRILPFASQVDDHTADPAWPHVHVEVVDPSIPDRPSPGGSDC